MEEGRFPAQAPVSQAAEKVVGVVFPLSLVLVLVYAYRKPMTYALAIKISLVFFLAMFFLRHSLLRRLSFSLLVIRERRAISFVRVGLAAFHARI